MGQLTSWRKFASTSIKRTRKDNNSTKNSVKNENTQGNKETYLN
jgi:hypothetical protein